MEGTSVAPSKTWLQSFYALFFTALGEGLPFPPFLLFAIGQSCTLFGILPLVSS